MAIISQSVSTTVMNLLLFLFYRKIYEPFTGEIIKAYNAKYESELMQTQSNMQFEKSIRNMKNPEGLFTI